MLTEKVLSWLNKTGFPLEMTGATEFRKQGFDVRQSVTYPDSQSDKGREIDVLASDSNWVGLIDVFFVLECKSSTNPWVVLIADDVLYNKSRITLFGVNTEGAKKVLGSRFPKNLGKLENFFWSPNRSGYGLRQAFGKENDPAYTAAIGVAKACYDLTREEEKNNILPNEEEVEYTEEDENSEEIDHDENDDIDNEKEIPYCGFAFPVIIVDSPLFECTQREDGTLELTEVMQSAFLFSAHIPQKIECYIRIVTRAGLPEFTKWARTLTDAIREEFRPEEDAYLGEEIASKEPNRNYRYVLVSKKPE